MHAAGLVAKKQHHKEMAPVAREKEREVADIEELKNSSRGDEGDGSRSVRTTSKTSIRISK